MIDRRRRRKPIKPEGVAAARDTRNLNIVETKREVIKTNVGKDKNVSITIENNIYTNPPQNSQGLVPPQYEPAFMSDLRQAMEGRNMHGGRRNANPFVYTPAPQVFTGASGQPVYNYSNPPPAFGAPPGVPAPGSAVPAPGSAVPATDPIDPADTIDPADPIDPALPVVDLGPDLPLFDDDGTYLPEPETQQEINIMNREIKKRKQYLRGELGNPQPRTIHKYSFTVAQVAKIRVLVAERAAAL